MGRTSEGATIIAASLLAAFAVALVNFANGGTVDSQVGLTFLVFLLAFGTVYMAVRAFAPRATPLLLPPVVALVALGFFEIYRLDPARAGLQRWWMLIARHPDVVGELKETHQLSRYGWRPMFDADRQAYYRYFPRPAGKLAGEWTPRYMNVPGVVDTMKALAPEAKLLVLLRDPVERYRSGVGQWQKRKERRGKRLNLWAGRKDAYARSFYAYALRPYVEAFGRDQLLVLQFERCLQDPADEYRRTLEFLGLPDWEPPPEILGKRVNVARRRPTPAELDEPPDLVASLEDDVRELLELAPDIDLSLWPNFRHLAAGGDGPAGPEAYAGS